MLVLGLGTCSAKYSWELVGALFLWVDWERERRSSVSWDVVCNWKANKVLQVHIIPHCIVIASNCRLCYGCNVMLRTLLLPTVMILGFYDFCHGLSKWGPCYMSSIPMKLTYYGWRVCLSIWKWLSNKLKVSLMKKLVQLSCRSNNPPTFLIQVFGKFRVEDE